MSNPIQPGMPGYTPPAPPPEATPSVGYVTGQANAATPGSGFVGAAFGQNQGGANAYSGGLAQLGAGFLNQTAPNPYDNQFGAQLGTDASQFAATQTGEQQQLAALQAQANGTGPNPAAQQIAAGTAQAQGQQQALAHSAGIGGAGALAARNALNTNATLGTQGANTTAQVNAQQQAAAAGQYSTLAGSMAQQQQQYQAQQQGLGMSYGGMQEAQNVQNAQNQMSALGQAQQVQQGQLTSDTSQATGAAAIATGQTLAQNAASAQSTASGISAGTAAGAAGASLVAGALASPVAGSQQPLSTYTSDARLKADIRDAGSTSLADSFLDHLQPYSFRYQHPEDEPSSLAAHHAGDPYLGVMAQDLESHPLGRQLVRDTPRGKAVQVAPAVGAALAGIGRLHDRVKELEAERDKGWSK